MSLDAARKRSRTKAEKLVKLPQKPVVRLLGRRLVVVAAVPVRAAVPAEEPPVLDQEAHNDAAAEVGPDGAEDDGRVRVAGQGRQPEPGQRAEQGEEEEVGERVQLRRQPGRPPRRLRKGGGRRRQLRVLAVLRPPPPAGRRGEAAALGGGERRVGVVDVLGGPAVAVGGRAGVGLARRHAHLGRDSIEERASGFRARSVVAQAASTMPCL
ncbi:hypothetical protein CDD83_10042 [Cordyceps sp. RAO-2017]|nr:hypothetical protein CDD83_10042 [Cordyceps sp. RAO-2017]